ncbi:porin [Burkholderia sp. Bp9131]|uniref:porin n=1 Tax=Burkholderia sp. Bp9131 TaxID=2184571 RepID=UPI000F562A5C|nr:porin [Burkholderia sp. Bp9131]RQR43463.1 porin [Burkholderia sp. Bp9131]
MKKGLVGLALAAASSATYAQSTVTLYGIVDEGILMNFNANGKHQYAMSSGGAQGNRWGLFGSEDLGGGLKAVFRLENGFDPSTGALNQGGRGFGRQAYVGLGNRFGTVTLGRQVNADADLVCYLNMACQLGYSTAHPGDLDNLNNTNRINNAIKFSSQSFAGTQFMGLYSIGGVAGNATQNQIWSLAAKYANGPMTLAAGYTNARNPNMSLWGGNANVSTTVASGTSFMTSPVYSGFTSAHSYQSISAGGSYVLGAATLSAVYSNTQFQNLGDLNSGPNRSGYTGNATFNNVEANINYKVTPSFSLLGAYDYLTRGSVSTRTGQVGSAHYQQVSLGADYFLSKRTDLYFIGVFQKASGTDSRNAPAVASINLLTPSSNDRQSALRVGIRHRF